MSETKCRLGDIARINPESLGVDTTSDYSFTYIDISSITQGVIDWSAVRNYQFCDAPSRARRIIRENDVLICTVRPGLQAHCFIDKSDNVNLVASTGFAVVRCGSDLNPRYLFHSLFGPDIPQQLRKKETGSNYPAVNEIDIQELLIFCPAINIQNAIAHILDNLDEVIQKTEQLIAKLKAIKQGLLHDLLTRGLDENGQLRDPVAHPEQFKDSPLGKIPKDWEVKKLGEILDYEQPTNYIVKSTQYEEYGVPVLTAGKSFILGYTSERENLYDNLPVIIFDDFTTESKWVNFPFKVKSSAMKLLKNKENTDLFFVYNAMQTLNFKPGSEHKRFWISEYSKLSIPLPSPSESQRCTYALLQIESVIEKEENYLTKLRLLKKGLMHDLLTGKVRVNITTENLNQVKEGDSL